MEMKQSTGIDQNGRYQTIATNADPNIGLNTLPEVLAVSIMPSPLLTSFSLSNISPTRGSTMGM